MTEEISLRQKVAAIHRVAKFRPTLTTGVVILSFGAALLEGIGLSFILPIVKYAQGADFSSEGGAVEIFITAYDLIGVPFTLENIILGVSLVITIRFVSRWIVTWLRARLQEDYVRYLRTNSFRGALDAPISYFDREGSDDILNTIITEANNASNVIEQLVRFLELIFVTIVYFALAVLITPQLTLFAVVILGTTAYVTRNLFESGFDVGDRVVDANERIQSTVQAGTQGVRDVKLFAMESEIFSNFQDAMDQYVDAKIRRRRNSAGLANLNQMFAALAVFVMIYLGLEYASLSAGSLGVFLVAMFRLSPRVSTMNNLFYEIETQLPHLIHAQQFIEQIRAQGSPTGEADAPEQVTRVEFEDVSFGYDESGQILREVSFSAEVGEFIAFVGQSGAGKSTIISLLARMYDPDSGQICANGAPITSMEVDAWRDRLAVVRQSPFIFNAPLRYNLTIGNRDATEKEIQRVVEIARVDEFLEDLPKGYDTMLGDNGVRLSGGQKQRVALARALLKDADVLILDEATSDLDTNIENEVQSAIEGMEQNYITITVAHRLSTVRNADRIYTMIDGEVADVGRHEELVERGGKYSELYSA